MTELLVWHIFKNILLERSFQSVSPSRAFADKKTDKKTYEKKYINRELQQQKINLETVSMLSFGQLLTGLEVRS